MAERIVERGTTRVGGRIAQWWPVGAGPDRVWRWSLWRPPVTGGRWSRESGSATSPEACQRALGGELAQDGLVLPPAPLAPAATFVEAA